MEAQKKSIINILKSLETETLLNVWNQYCDDENPDDRIYDNDEYNLNQTFSNVDEALRAACYGDYRYTDSYFIINSYDGNLESFGNNSVEEHIDFDTLADYIMNYDCSEIQTVWLEDIYADFVDFFNETFNTNIDIDEDTDFFDKVNDYNLLTDDWDTIAKEIKEEM